MVGDPRRQRVHEVCRVERIRAAERGELDLSGLPGTRALPGRGRRDTLPSPIGVSDVALLRGLWGMSSSRRGPTRGDAQSARAAVEFEATATRLLAAGVRMVDLASAIGATEKAVRNRLARAGVRMREVRGE